MCIGIALGGLLFVDEYHGTLESSVGIVVEVVEAQPSRVDVLWPACVPQ